ARLRGEGALDVIAEPTVGVPVAERPGELERAGTGHRAELRAEGRLDREALADREAERHTQDLSDGEAELTVQREWDRDAPVASVDPAGEVDRCTKATADLQLRPCDR